MPSAPATSPVHNRLLAVLRHTRRYAFRGQIRLARDAGVTRSAISRLLSGQRTPSFDLALVVVGLLEKDLGRPLPLRELFSFDGTYPTPLVCKVLGCPGCLPDEVYDADENVLPHFRHVRSGEWSPDLLSIGHTADNDPVADDTS